MTVLLHGLSLANYRGIGALQQIGPFGRCNFFIGANNVGKSTILNFLRLHAGRLPELGKSQDDGLGFSAVVSVQLDKFEPHWNKADADVTFGIGLPPRMLVEAVMNDGTNVFYQSDPDVEAALLAFCTAISEKHLVWLSGPAPNINWATLDQGRIEEAMRSMPADIAAFAPLVTRLRKHESPTAANVAAWLKRQGFQFGRVESHYVPPFRQVGEPNGKFEDFSGAGLIEHLAILHSPRAEDRDARSRFTKINSFLQEVSNLPNARLQVPHDRSQIQVEIGERVFPLSSLGTGIHQVVMIACFCTLAQNSIVSIEEPEIHLHPLLQRKLIDYLLRETDNQYFVTTHSASLIDHPEATIFHVTQENNETRFGHAISMPDRVAIWRDLGYKPSDLLQTNFIIWVEGPSDRLYILHWLEAMGANLTEGAHFTIMFYGGKLLSHLSGDLEAGADTDSDASDSLIELRRINQHMAIVIDSDRAAATDPRNQTKQRIVEQFESGKSMAWVTAGREIENYHDPDLIEEALKATYQDFVSMPYKTKYGDNMALYRTKERDDGKPHQASKVAIARYVCSKAAALDRDDLRAKLAALIGLIRQANDLPH